MPRVPGPKTLGPGVITYAQTGCQAMQEPHTLTHRPKLASERPHFPRPRNEDLHRTPSRRGSLSAGSYTSNHNLHRTPLRKAYFRPGVTPSMDTIERVSSSLSSCPSNATPSSGFLAASRGRLSYLKNGSLNISLYAPVPTERITNPINCIHKNFGSHPISKDTDHTTSVHTESSTMRWDALSD